MVSDDLYPGGGASPPRAAETKHIHIPLPHGD